jgi:hypothetical protein
MIGLVASPNFLDTCFTHGKRGEIIMKKNLFMFTAGIVMLASSISSWGWNLGATYIEALTLNDDGTIQFTLLDPDPAIYDFKCDVNGVSPWFEIGSCDVGNGGGPFRVS